MEINIDPHHRPAGSSSDGRNDMRTPFFDGELTGASGVRSRKGQSSKCQQQDSTREKDIANTPNSIENPAGESSAFMEPAVGQADAGADSDEAR